MEKEVPLFNSDIGPCAMFDFTTLKTSWSERGYKAILQYVTERGIFGDDTVEKSVLLELKNAASEYHKAKGRFMCFHIETRTGRPVKVTVGVHGFFPHLSDPSLLEHLTLKVHMSMSVLEGCTVLDPDFPLRQTGNVVPHRSGGNQTTADTCIGGEHFIQVEISDPLEMVATVLSSSQLEAQPPTLLSGLIKLVFVDERQRLAHVSFWEKLHKRRRHSDFEIHAGGGVVYPCHKVILAAHSPTLAARFQIQSKSDKIDMPEVSEEVVESFLDFLYKRDLKIPMERCEVAMGLLELGHEYDVDIIESAVERMFLAKPNDWFSKKVALQLFLFAVKHVEGGQKLKQKALAVIKSKARGMSASHLYLEFIKENPFDALDLLESAFTSCSPEKAE